MSNRNLLAMRAQMPVLVEDPATINEAAVRPDLFLGGIYYYGGKAYKYVQFKDAVAYLAGHVCLWANAQGTAVTNDKTGGSAVIATTPVAGVAPRVMTEDYYGFIQVGGVATIQTDGSVTVGKPLVSHTVDGEASMMVDGEEEQVFATSLQADTGDQVSATLKGCM